MPTYREQLVHQLQCEGAFTADAARELVDAHTDQVLTEDGQAYPGELAMYRHLIRTLRVAARNADWDAVRQALVNHAADDGVAREKSTTPSGDATPQQTEAGE